MAVKPATCSCTPVILSAGRLGVSERKDLKMRKPLYRPCFRSLRSFRSRPPSHLAQDDGGLCLEPVLFHLLQKRRGHGEPGPISDDAVDSALRAEGGGANTAGILVRPDFDRSGCERRATVKAAAQGTAQHLGAVVRRMAVSLTDVRRECGDSSFVVVHQVRNRQLQSCLSMRRPTALLIGVRHEKVLAHPTTSKRGSSRFAHNRRHRFAGRRLLSGQPRSHLAQSARRHGAGLQPKARAGAGEDRAESGTRR